MDIRNQPLLPGNIYHLFNCGVGYEKIFRTNENYLFFIEKISKYILPVCDILAYCLLPDHFHLMIKVKPEQELTTFAKTIKKEKINLPAIISEQFSNCFNSYTKSYNKVFKRHGKLFDLPFKRIEVSSDIYYTVLIAYIHRNPVHHGYVKDFTDWKFSSYNAFLSDKPTKISRNEILAWFGNANEFIKFHQGSLEQFNDRDLFLE